MIVNTASDILAEAATIVAGSRNDTHGDKARSFVAIAEMWTAYLAQRRKPLGPVRAQDVAAMMVLLKQMRAEWGCAVREHYVDAAGYAAIAGELTLAQPAALPRTDRALSEVGQAAQGGLRHVQP